MAVELIKKSVRELKELAKKMKIKGYAKMKKSELVKLISKMAKTDSKKSSGRKKETSKTTSKKVSKTGRTKTKRTKSSSVDEMRHVKENIYDAQERISDSKYTVAYDSIPSFSEENFVFPLHYGKDNIVLMVRDPFWVYTYWNLTEKTFENLRAQYGNDMINNGKLVLRVKDVTNTHPDSPNEFNDIYPPYGANNWYINVKRNNASYCTEIGFLLPNNQFILIARSNVVHVPNFGPSDIVDEKWVSVIDFEKLYALSGGFDIGRSSGELQKEMVKHLQNALFSGGSGAVSSFGKPKKAVYGKGKSFFLIVNTELIVYGKTVPTADLTIQGRKHKLNPDGTFSIRFALPEGVHEIPVTAVSEDKEDKITITPVVTKETK